MTRPDFTQHPPEVEPTGQHGGVPSGTCPGGSMGMSPSGPLYAAPRRRLSTILFWTGEVLGALSLFVILWGGLILAALAKQSFLKAKHLHALVEDRYGETLELVCDETG